jgi:short-subunit dehydrogenase
MNPKISSWNNKRVWIIGASSGIGAALAQQLLLQGARVALSARNQSALAELAKQAQLVHPTNAALVLPLDVKQADQVQLAFTQIMHEWHGIDLVCVVAGVYNEMRADTFDLTTANALIDVNLRGVLNCLAATLPTLLTQKNGGIGIVSSVAGLSGLPKALIYGPTKAALINLCESLYIDLHPRGNAVYLINPGFVATSATANNDFTMPALITAEEAAKKIMLGMEQGDFHIHFPKRFTNWLRLARLLPYAWYFKLIHKVTGL